MNLKNIIIAGLISILASTTAYAHTYEMDHLKRKTKIECNNDFSGHKQDVDFVTRIFYLGKKRKPTHIYSVDYQHRNVQELTFDEKGNMIIKVTEIEEDFEQIYTCNPKRCNLEGKVIPFEHVRNNYPLTIEGLCEGLPNNSKYLDNKGACKLLY